MKGLLLKDIYTVVGNMRAFLVLIIIFSIVPNMPISPFAMIYAAMLPINALAWDEQSKWNNLADMMPYSKFQLVFTKYLFGYICLFCAALLSAIFAFVGYALPFVNVDLTDALLTSAASLIAGLILMNVNLPLMFRLGVEKGRLVFGLITGGFMLLYVMGLGAVENLDMGYVPVALVGGIAAAVAVILSVVSVLLSMKWYGKNN